MASLTINELLLLLGLAVTVKADILDKKFLIRLEDITNTNRDLMETNRGCNKTVLEQRQMMTNLNITVENIKTSEAEKDATIGKLQATIESLNATVTDQDTIIQALNLTLSTMQTVQEGELHT